MNKTSIKEFSKSVLKKGVEFFLHGAYSCTQLEGFQNIVYKIDTEHEKFILRFSHSTHRSYSTIAAELDWIMFLSSNGLLVATPNKSLTGKSIETIKTKIGYYAVVSFKWAEGHIPTRKNFTPSFYFQWGKLVAKLHLISNKYIPNNGKRPEWHEEDNFNADKFLVKEHHRIIKAKLKSLIQQIQTLPVTKSTYGLIHSDIYTKNFHIKDEKITLFDFDGSMYSWFAHDIAVVLYDQYASNSFYRTNQSSFSLFINHFLNGYLKVKPCDWNFYEDIKLFIKLEAFGRYIMYQRSKTLPNISGNVNDYVTYLKYSLENDFPIFPNNTKIIVNELS